MDALSYLKRAAGYGSLAAEDFKESAKVALVTNFTDELFEKLLVGLSLEAGIYPKVFREPYKQYHFDLAQGGSALYANEADITFMVFDVNPYLASEFTEDDGHFTAVIEGIRAYAKATKGHVVVASFPLSLLSAYGNLSDADPLLARVRKANEELGELSKELVNISVLDLNRLIARTGDGKARDMRALYAFDMPFTTEFTLGLAKECVSYLFALRGRSRKCIVVDLDNTLWGGVLGEVGSAALELGPGYPGLAYRSFQQTLLSYRDRGILLAIASRNNPEEVDEVFSKNANMVLKKEHFSAIRTNWQTKSENLLEIAKELNIGLDSLVFLDDDGANREEVRSLLPAVLVPELPAFPEEFAPTLLRLTCFNQLALTEEDRRKAELYRTEESRNELRASVSPEEYLERLNIVVSIYENNPAHIPRAAQLSQKTNQFNLTTERYTEADIEGFIQGGASVFTAEVSDNFGNYGIVALLIARFEGKERAVIDTLLMSCRVFARGVEYALTDHVIETLSERGYRTLMAAYRRTEKNEPVRDFLPKAGFVPDRATGPNEIDYSLSTEAYAKSSPPEMKRILPRLTVTPCQN